MTSDTESWLEVRIAGSSDPESVIAALFEEGSQGIQEIGADIVTYFPSTAPADRIRSTVNAADPRAIVSIQPTTLPDGRAWREGFVRHRIGALTVSPPWLSDALDPATTIVIDPAMAFGTGEHATTRGVLRLMQKIPVADRVVADLGAGSGILSIAAAKLGAKSVIAIEMDPDAAGNASENIVANQVARVVHFIEGDAFAILPLVAPVDVIFANILSSVLLDLLPLMGDSLVPGGKAILSGILTDERPTMLRALENSGWGIDDEDIEGEWWTVLISRA